ncbi:MAG TPA: hypothetical protein P5137_15290 [Candidatus Brocadiia bacterium]|nr:hypothetical protein [Candidatus Brocadiia bacterium]
MTLLRRLLCLLAALVLLGAAGCITQREQALVEDTGTRPPLANLPQNAD